jgi:hypothetical protein
MNSGGFCESLTDPNMNIIKALPHGVFQELIQITNPNKIKTKINQVLFLPSTLALFRNEHFTAPTVWYRLIARIRNPKSAPEIPLLYRIDSSGPVPFLVATQIPNDSFSTDHKAYPHEHDPSSSVAR